MDIGALASLVGGGSGLIALGLSVWATVVSRRSARAAEESRDIARHVADEADRPSFGGIAVDAINPTTLSFVVTRADDGPPLIDVVVTIRVTGWAADRSDDGGVRDEDRITRTDTFMEKGVLRGHGLGRVIAFDRPVGDLTVDARVEAAEPGRPGGRPRAWDDAFRSTWRAPRRSDGAAGRGSPGPAPDP